MLGVTLVCLGSVVYLRGRCFNLFAPLREDELPVLVSVLRRPVRPYRFTGINITDYIAIPKHNVQGYLEIRTAIFEGVPFGGQSGVLCITEKRYSSVECIGASTQHDSIDTRSRPRRNSAFSRYSMSTTKVIAQYGIAPFFWRKRFASRFWQIDFNYIQANTGVRRSSDPLAVVSEYELRTNWLLGFLGRGIEILKLNSFLNQIRTINLQGDLCSTRTLFSSSSTILRCLSGIRGRLFHLSRDANQLPVE